MHPHLTSTTRFHLTTAQTTYNSPSIRPAATLQPAPTSKVASSGPAPEIAQVVIDDLASFLQTQGATATPRTEAVDTASDSTVTSLTKMQQGLKSAFQDANLVTRDGSFHVDGGQIKVIKTSNPLIENILIQQRSGRLSSSAAQDLLLRIVMSKPTPSSAAIEESIHNSGLVILRKPQYLPENRGLRVCLGVFPSDLTETKLNLFRSLMNPHDYLVTAIPPYAKPSGRWLIHQSSAEGPAQIGILSNSVQSEAVHIALFEAVESTAIAQQSTLTAYRAACQLSPSSETCNKATGKFQSATCAHYRAVRAALATYPNRIQSLKSSVAFPDFHNRTRAIEESVQDLKKWTHDTGANIFIEEPFYTVDTGNLPTSAASQPLCDYVVIHPDTVTVKETMDRYAEQLILQQRNLKHCESKNTSPAKRSRPLSA